MAAAFDPNSIPSLFRDLPENIFGRSFGGPPPGEDGFARWLKSQQPQTPTLGKNGVYAKVSSAGASPLFAANIALKQGEMDAREQAVAEKKERNQTSAVKTQALAVEFLKAHPDYLAFRNKSDWERFAPGFSTALKQTLGNEGVSEESFWAIVDDLKGVALERGGTTRIAPGRAPRYIPTPTDAELEQLRADAAAELEQYGDLRPPPPPPPPRIIGGAMGAPLATNIAPETIRTGEDELKAAQGARLTYDSAALPAYLQQKTADEAIHGVVPPTGVTDESYWASGGTPDTGPPTFETLLLAVEVAFNKGDMSRKQAIDRIQEIYGSFPNKAYFDGIAEAHIEAWSDALSTLEGLAYNTVEELEEAFYAGGLGDTAANNEVGAFEALVSIFGESSTTARGMMDQWIYQAASEDVESAYDYSDRTASSPRTDEEERARQQENLERLTEIETAFKQGRINQDDAGTRLGHLYRYWYPDQDQLSIETFVGNQLSRFTSRYPGAIAAAEAREARTAAWNALTEEQKAARRYQETTVQWLDVTADHYKNARVNFGPRRRRLAEKQYAQAVGGYFLQSQVPSEEASPGSFWALVKEDPDPSTLSGLPGGLQTFRNYAEAGYTKKREDFYDYDHIKNALAVQLESSRNAYIPDLDQNETLRRESAQRVSDQKNMLSFLMGGRTPMVLGTLEGKYTQEMRDDPSQAVGFLSWVKDRAPIIWNRFIETDGNLVAFEKYQ
jgi:hypothetical protein